MPEVLVGDKRVLARARKKVGDRRVDGRAMTPAMVDTPRVRLVRQARYGRWSAFPVDVSSERHDQRPDLRVVPDSKGRR